MKPIPLLILAALCFATSCEIMPRNTISDCRQQCMNSNKSKACMVFCDCIHLNGTTLDSCLEAYNKTPADSLNFP